MKVIAGLGNPGAEYEDTRHNVGWWVVDRLAYDWKCEPFRREPLALVTAGVVGEEESVLVKPTTYMNRSGAALVYLLDRDDFVLARDLLVVVDDAALDVGRVRFRSSGGSGGHNGLESVCSALGSDRFSRLRIGVGRNPEGVDLADWVLSGMSPGEEDVIVALLPELTYAVEEWIGKGIELAMSLHNR